MSFDVKSFARLTANNVAGAPKIYSYKTDSDTLADVKASGYFNDIAFEVAIKDLIVVIASDDHQLLTVEGKDPVTTDAFVNLDPEGIASAMDAMTTKSPLQDSDRMIVQADGGLSAQVTTIEALLADVVANGGSVKSLQADLITNRPAFGNLDHWFLALDEPAIYLDKGTAWEKVAGTVIAKDIGNTSGDVAGVDEIVTALDTVDAGADFSAIMASVGQGAIVDVIENSNGIAIRFESGLQVAYIVPMTLPFQNADNYAETWTLPAVFSNALYYVVTSPYGSPSAPTGGFANWGVMSNTGGVFANECAVRVYNSGQNFNSADASVQVRVLAIGEWK